MNYIYDAIEQAEAAIESCVKQGRRVEAEDLGLDDRASYGRLAVVRDAIIACSADDARVLNYYGGFEYVEDEYVKQVGKYTIYFADDARVQEAIDWLNSEDEAA